MTNKCTTPEEMGYKAYKDGLNITDNPYTTPVVDAPRLTRGVVPAYSFRRDNYTRWAAAWRWARDEHANAKPTIGLTDSTIGAATEGLTLLLAIGAATQFDNRYRVARATFMELLACIELGHTDDAQAMLGYLDAIWEKVND